MRRILYIVTLVLSFLLCISFVNAKELEDGTYIISSSLDPYYSIDIPSANVSNGTLLQLYKTNWTNAQKWIVKKESDGYYSIKSLINEYYSIDVTSANYNNGVNIQLYSSNNTLAQKWTIKDAGDDYYYILSSNNSYALDVPAANAFNGSKIQLYNFNRTNAQKFLFTKVIEGTKNLDDGIYTISSALNDNMVIESAGGGISNNANVQLYSSNNTEAQKWKVSYIGNGFYKTYR